MKKITLAVLTLMMSMGVYNANAQRTSFDVSLNLAPIAVSNYSINAGYNFAPEMTVGTVIGYQNLKLSSTDMNGDRTEYTYGGIYFAPEFRYYFDPTRSGNDGYFAGGYLKVRTLGTTGDALFGFDENDELIEYDESNFGAALGIVAGRMWTTRIGLTFQTWAGFGYFLFNSTSYTNDYDPEKDSFFGTIESNIPDMDFRLGVNVGYRF